METGGGEGPVDDGPDAPAGREIDEGGVDQGARAVLGVAVALSPETVRRPELPLPYRPQRIVVPAHARRTFLAATSAGMAAFAVYGVFNSVVPTFLAGTLHQTSQAVDGAVAFAAFAAGAVAQIAQARVTNLALLRRSVPTITVGLGLLGWAMWGGGPAMFVIGGVITGAGAGMVFKGSLVAAASVAPDGSRAEVLAAFFLGAYVGLSVPVVGLGVATTYAPARDVLAVFAALAAVAVTASVRALTGVPTPLLRSTTMPDLDSANQIQRTKSSR